jgi:hypothetical protein
MKPIAIRAAFCPSQAVEPDQKCVDHRQQQNNEDRPIIVGDVQSAEERSPNDRKINPDNQNGKSDPGQRKSGPLHFRPRCGICLPSYF